MTDLFRTLLALGMCLPLLSSAVLAHPGHSHSHEGEQPRTEATAAAVENKVEITVRGEYRYINSNGIPDHEAGRFPNRGNPHTIEAQDYHFRVPAEPRVAKSLTPLGHQPFGVAVNGLVFDPGTAEFWRNDRRSGWNYEAQSGKINLGLDQNLAHVQPSGAYHYHGIPAGLIEILGGNQDKMLLLGYAADGFPIYAPRVPTDALNADSPLKEMQSSYRVKKGTREGGPGGSYDGTFVQDYEYVAGLGDLDEANGRTGVTPEYPQGTYYYVLTDEYPFIPRQFRGTPDASFERQGPPPGGPGPGGAGPGGPGGPPGRPPFPPGGRRPPR